MSKLWHFTNYELSAIEPFGYVIVATIVVLNIMLNWFSFPYML